VSGLPWIPLDVGFSTGEHAIALRVALQEEFAWARVVKLWSWVAVHRADGRVEGPAAVQIIESAAGWTGTPGAFVEVLCLPHINLLDHTSSGFYVHNWHLHCGAHIEKREKDRERHRVPKSSGGSKKPPRKLRGTSKEDYRSLPGESAQETDKDKEREKDKDLPITSRSSDGENRLAGESTNLRKFREDLSDALGLTGLIAIAKPEEAQRVADYFEAQLQAVGPEFLLRDCLKAADKAGTTPGSLKWLRGWVEKLHTPAVRQ
jgi:hypothetical protein